MATQQRSRLGAVVKGKKKKVGPSIDEIRKTVASYSGRKLTEVEKLPLETVREMYVGIIRTTKEYVTTEKKINALKREVKALERDIKSINEVEVSFPLTAEQLAEQKKLASISHIYKTIPQELLGIDDGNKGGVYAHLTRKSVDTLLTTLCTYTKFNRLSALLDVGGGLNVFALHAAIGYCGYAVGIEIDASRVQRGAEIMVKYFHSLGNDVRNHRVAMVYSDVRNCLPVDYASHAYLFDLVIEPESWLQILDWLAISTIQHVVTFKPAREPSYLHDVLEKLGAVEVARVSGLRMAGSNRQCTAIILSRENPPEQVPAPPFGQSSLVDSKSLARPFMQEGWEDTLAEYRTLLETATKVVDLKDRPRAAGRSKTIIDQCLSEDFIACAEECNACSDKFRPMAPTDLFVKSSAIDGQGLFTRVRITSGTLVATYTGTTVLEGVAPSVNHSCSPNAFLQKAYDQNGIEIMLVITSKDVPDQSEITIDYGDDYLNEMTCLCESSECRERMQE